MGPAVCGRPLVARSSFTELHPACAPPCALQWPDSLAVYSVQEELATPEELKAIAKECRAEVDAAVRESEASPPPEEAELFTHVYR